MTPYPTTPALCSCSHGPFVLSVVIHDILSTIIWARDNPDRQAQQRRSALQPGRHGSAIVSVNKYFDDDIQRRFILNRDPNAIHTLVDKMKEDFRRNSSGSVAPTRVIFFNGASSFYQTLYSTPQNQYWRTGWRDGSAFNPLEAEVKGLTYCER